MHLLALLLWAAGLLTPFEENGKWGYRDAGGKVAIYPRYEMAQPFSREGIAAVVDAKGWAYIDSFGRVAVRPLVFDNGPDYFKENLARFQRDGKTGFFDRRGRITIEARYTWAMPFSEGRAVVCEGCVETAEGEHRTYKGGKWGYIDLRGVLVIPLEFDDAGSFEKGRARVRSGALWRYIARDGRTVPD